jgi:hypothetical protein
MASIEPVLLYRETAPRRRAFLITPANFSDIGQRWWELTRAGGSKSESVGGIQPVGSSKPNRFPPGVPFKPLFQGQRYLLFTKPFTKPFTDELISLGYRDTMWDREAMENFF